MADRPVKDEVELFARIGAERYYTVEEKEKTVLRRLRASGSAVFEEMFEDCRGKSEAVAVFLAILELISSGKVGVRRDGDSVTLKYEETGGTAAETEDDAVE